MLDAVPSVEKRPDADPNPAPTAKGAGFNSIVAVLRDELLGPDPFASYARTVVPMDRYVDGRAKLKVKVRAVVR